MKDRRNTDDDRTPEVRRLRAILRAWRAYGRARAAIEATRDVLSPDLEVTQAAVAKAKARLVNLKEWPRTRRSAVGSKSPGGGIEAAGAGSALT